MAARGKLVLVVVDGLGLDLYARALADGRAPTLAALAARGTTHPPCASTFPSLTPACLSSLVTGTHPAGHRIPGLTWYRRGEGRFVEYGSSFAATLVEGSFKAIEDALLNINHVHLSDRLVTLFEAVEDAGRVAASINFFVFRGRQRHPIRHKPARAVARRIGMFDAVYGPTRFFFGELFQSDRTGAVPNFGIQGRNDRQAADVGRWLVARDGFDLLVHYLPEVDMASHRVGPAAALDAVEAADRSVHALVEASGGIDGFLERYGLIVVADHGQVQVERTADIRPAFADLRLFAGSLRSDPASCQVALAPTNRAAMAYRLADAPSAEELARRMAGVDGVDVVGWRDPDDLLHAARGDRHLAFRRDPAGVEDGRGNRWALVGDRAALDLETTPEGVRSGAYPNALERLEGLLLCVNAGEAVASAAPGVEFVDAGGSSHAGGSHGSLHACDSLVPLVTAGVDTTGLPLEPSITDIYGLALRHVLG